MKQLFKRLNNFTIRLVLTPFYFLVIGIGRLLHLAQKPHHKTPETYWENTESPFRDYTSPY